jgi:tetratricopeptide (TPR) repeat protein
MDVLKKILISHAHEEKALAEAWKELIEETSLGRVSTWFSSDKHVQGGVSLGEPWREDLYSKLSASDYILAIQSPVSQSRSWIMWECGVASGINKERGIIPIVYSIGRGDLANPLSVYQAYQGEDPDQVREVCERLASAAGLMKLRDAVFEGPIKEYLQKVNAFRPSPALRAEQMGMWRDRFEQLITSGRSGEVLAVRQMMYTSFGKPFQPVEPKIHEYLSQKLFEQRAYKQAIEEINYALRLIKDDVTLLHRKALALVELQNLQDAEDIVNYIVSLNGELKFNSEIASLEGRIHRERWVLTQDLLELETAISSYLRAYETDKTQYYPGINAAELALAKGDTALAERLFQEILVVCKQLQSEQNVSYWVDFTVGALYLGLGDVDVAIAEYKSGLNRTTAPSLRDRESAVKGAARMANLKKLPDEVVEKIKALLA